MKFDGEIRAYSRGYDGLITLREYVANKEMSEVEYYSYFITCIGVLSETPEIELGVCKIANAKNPILTNSVGDVEVTAQDALKVIPALEKLRAFQNDSNNEVLGYLCDGKINGRTFAFSVIPREQKIIIATPDNDPANLYELEKICIILEYGDDPMFRPEK